MVRHDMKAEKTRRASEQIRLGLGLLTLKEQEALAKREAEKAAKEAKKALLGPSLLEGL